MRTVRNLLTAAAVTAAVVTAAPPALAGGTHFLVQLQGGLALSPADQMDVTFGYGFTFGYGGRLRGTPLRFYGFFAFDRASFDLAGVNPDTGRTTTGHWSHNDFQAGIRMLIPVWWRLRWYVEAMVGASYVESESDWSRELSTTETDTTTALSAATGLEVRWARNFATGLRAGISWYVNVFCPADLSQLCPSEISREMSWDGAEFSVPSHTLFPG